MMRVATYARVSTLGQSERGHSLAEQKATLAAYCEKNQLTLVEHVSDAAVSGTIADRPGIVRLRELVAARVIDAIICAKVDRLARKAFLGEAFIDEMARLGVAVIFSDQQFAPGAVGDLTRGILGHVAQFEHSQITERLISGRTRKAKDRAVMPSGRPPFGFRQVSVSEARAVPAFAGRDGETLIVEEEAAVVREAFRRYAAGEPMADLCRWLQEDPVAGSRGVWKHVRLKWMLRNEAYAGVRRFRGQVIPCPAIVSPEVWQATQARLERSSTSSGRPSLAYLLSGCVFCDECKNQNGTPRRCVGWRMAHHPGARRYYRCPSVSDSFRESCGISIRAERLETMVRKQLEFNFRPGVLAAEARRLAELEWATGNSVEVEIARLRQTLAQLDKEEGRILDLALAGFSPALIQQRLRPVQARRSQAEAALAAAEHRQAHREEPDLVAARVEAAVEQAREDLHSTDPARVRRVCQAWVRVTLRFAKQPVIRIAIPG